ncbi:hypothetical protein [Acidipila sp. EB88]|uniref:hypothetical protein n=1 Tax=Acidipila sp. EB88 TaxID=2305226 RepID=UPI000F5D7C81|nr:hypothetical protein [Acidipila sp. EB88]RRA48722.1 hypothetical protein D1Y84_10945 [Acidipila sp. EB88]
MNTETRAVEDSIAKVDNELAVGEDLDFQRRWWRFEKWIWRFFALLVLADIAGLFGRGPLAKAQKHTPDGAMHIKYERIERFSTPSILTIQLGPASVRKGTVHVWVSSSVVDRLGNQRVIPAPSQSEVVKDGVIYTFPADDVPSEIAFALQPADIGLSHLTIRLLDADNKPLPAQDYLNLDIFVMP